MKAMDDLDPRINHLPGTNQSHEISNAEHSGTSKRRLTFRRQHDTI